MTDKNIKKKVDRKIGFLIQIKKRTEDLGDRGDKIDR